MLYMYRRIFFTNIEGWECDPFDRDDLSNSKLDSPIASPVADQPIPDVVQTSEEIQDVAIPHIIEYGKIRFYLSQELLKGMEGGRDDHHEIALDTLEPCLHKVSKKLGKVKQDKKFRFEYYFKQKNGLLDNTYDILRLIIDSYPQKSLKEEKKKFTVITCFYVPDKEVKRQLNENDYNQWIKTIAELK